MASYENPWIFQDKEVESEDIQDCQGFVYMITNLEDGKFYIGKKNAWTLKTVYGPKNPKTGKKKKSKVKIEYDWKTYYGSSVELLADIEKLGKDKFKREILHFCTNKSQLAYLELREQIDRRVLERDDSYNSWIMVRCRKEFLKLQK